MPGENEDETHRLPPEPMRVARRALIQSAVVCRGSIELDAIDPDVGETHERLCAWLEHLDLFPAMEPMEKKILTAPLGALNRQQVIRATWAAEGLAILAWALRRFDLAEHDAKVDPFALTASLGLLDEDAISLVNEAELRAPDELQACREMLYAIHCRFGQHRRGEPRMDFMTWIEPGWLVLLGMDQSAFLVEGDLGIDGKSIDNADETLVKDGEWITQRRHQASIWLLGEYQLYTETPADI
jgi:hypothetical protein